MNWKYIFIIISFSLKAQAEKENNYISKGNGLHENKSYVDAEAEFRKALSINQDNPIANQNFFIGFKTLIDIYTPGNAIKATCPTNMGKLI